MKNFLKIFMGVIFVLLVFAGNTKAGDRLILIERYTSTTCGPCAGANPGLDAFLNSSDPSKVTSISYHMSWPAPGNDPMYLYNTADNNGRRGYYGVNSIPHGQFDGNTRMVPAYSSAASLYAARTNVLSPVTVIVEQTPAGGDSMKVKVTVFCEDLLSDPSVTIHIAILEREITYGSPPGTNGETHFIDVMRKMLPSVSGTKVNLFPGQKVILEETYYMDPIWDSTKVEPVAFVQSGSKEILNTGRPTLDYTLLSDYAYRVVNQGQSQDADYQISVPVVAPAYNETVTLSTEVTPPTAGITASFTAGNTISSFPGSVNLNISSSAAVPAGVYKVVVTGTNGSGDEHKIVVTYLVGKSYVGVGTDKPSLLFKVDGNTFGTTQLYTWDVGATHNIEAITPQGAGNTRYAFKKWSNGDTNLAQTITVNTSETSYIAEFTTQYKIQTNIVPGGIPANVIGGNEFYDEGSNANIEINPTQVTHNGTVYYFQRWLGAGVGSYTGTNPSFQVTGISNSINQIAVFDTINTSIGNYSSEIPEKFELYQNYPNPFNPETNIRFDIATAGLVNLTVYNILGEQLEVLQNGVLNAGRYEYNWNASQYASGVYFYRIETESFVSIKRLVLLK